MLGFTSSVAMAGSSFAVYSVIIGLDPECSHSSVIVSLEPEVSRLRYREKTVGASFAVYFVIIGLDLELSCSSVIVALELELLCLGFQDVESCLPHQFGNPDIGFL